MNPYTLNGDFTNKFKHGRVDKNQAEIVHALRQVGASVTSLADVGQGCPDLLVGFQGKTFLLEVKNPHTSRNKNCSLKDCLSPAQITWHLHWKGGELYVVSDTITALKVIGVPILQGAENNIHSQKSRRKYPKNEKGTNK